MDCVELASKLSRKTRWRRAALICCIGVVDAEVYSLVVRLWGGVVDPLLPVCVDLRVPGLGGEPRVEERVVHPVPTMVL